MSDTRVGVINAIAAYLMWGFAPIYFKLLANISATEILMHRVVWACALLFILVVMSKKTKQLIALFQQPTAILHLLISALFLAANWFIFIWAVNNNKVLDASLGYYINPLFSVALGMIFLGERLRKWQWFAVILAFIGVLIQFVTLGAVPVISFALAGTFGIYGLLRKKRPVDSFVGLFVESSLLLPVALIYWWFFLQSDTANLVNNSLHLNVIFLLAGVVTTLPLLCFTSAAKRISLSALGFFQYIGPSLMFLLAILLYQEPLSTAKLTTFVFIWSALFIFSIDAIKQQKRKLY